MFQSASFVILVIVSFAFTSVEGLPSGSNVNVAFVHNLTTYLIENPEVKVLYPLVKHTSDGTSRSLLIYSDGSRTDGKSSKLKKRNSIENKSNSLIYPSPGR